MKYPIRAPGLFPPVEQHTIPTSLVIFVQDVLSIPLYQKYEPEGFVPDSLH